MGDERTEREAPRPTPRFVRSVGRASGSYRYVSEADLVEEYRLRPRTVRYLKYERVLPFYRPARGTVLWERSVVDQWIESGKVASVEDEVARRVARSGRA